MSAPSWVCSSCGWRNEYREFRCYFCRKDATAAQLANVVDLGPHDVILGALSDGLLELQERIEAASSKAELIGLVGHAKLVATLATDLAQKAAKRLDEVMQ